MRRRAAWLDALAGALWVPQAGLIAHAVGRLAQPGAIHGLPIGHLAAFAVLALIRVGLGALATRLGHLGSEAVKTDLRHRLIERIGEWSPLDPAKPGSGTAAALVSTGIEGVEPYLVRYGSARLRMSAIPVFIALVVATQSWIAAIILVITGPLIPVFMFLIGGRARAASDRQLAEVLTVNDYLADRLAGLRDIKLLGAVPVAAEQLADHARRIKQATMGVLRIAFLSSALLEFFSALGVALMAVYVGFSLLGILQFGTYGGPLSLTSGLFVLILAPEFFAPMRDFSAAYHDRADALAAAAALRKVLDRPFVPVASPRHTAPMEPGGPPGVRLSRVTFTYTGAAGAALEGFDLDVAPGEHVALVGPSGSGKTTLLSLIAGLAAPTGGDIVFPSGQSALMDAPPEIVWLSQHPHFFKTTVRRNLTLGREAIPPDLIADALRLARADDVVARLPHGLATILGEGATGISGGEAQRLAIARAALSDARLILADEPTAHLDPQTARDVVAGIKRLAAGRTMIVATHDTELAAAMDRRIALSRPGAPGP